MTNTSLSLAGVFPPIPTPFSQEGAIDHAMARRNLALWNRFDLAGYVVLGSTGEAVYLTTDEKADFWEMARSAIPADRLMIAGAGCESTRETIAVTRLAARQGADAALVVTPHYYDAGMTSQALVHHYRAVADAVPIPILLYSVPQFTHVDLGIDAIVALAEHPNIIGLKDSGGSVAKLTEIIRQAPEDFQVLTGSAGVFLAALTLGAVGGVLALANIAPQACIDLYRHVVAGRIQEAVAVQTRMAPVNAATTSRFGIPGLKTAMDMLGYEGGATRSPLLPPSEVDRETLRQVLVAGGLL
ncbi:MAG: dihydrodipicolinate synthase family protein [Anaerolineae bacterium]|nr:dihydrodipicolinate synthase family protein [Anaerolineae bacterium]